MNNLRFRIPPAVARKLGHYVYLLTDPRNRTVFYVGKGKNGRILAHLRGEENAITKKMEEIRTAGAEPLMEILAHGLGKQEAHKIESAAIDLLLDLGNLVNAVRGHGAKTGRMGLSDAIAYHTKVKAKFRKDDRLILIRINKLYRYGMSDSDLYDATRSAWRVDADRCKRAEYALAVFQGVVREVYAITGWFPAGTTLNFRPSKLGITEKDRWEFVGNIAADHIRKRFLNRYVGHLFKWGAMGPISYVNVEAQ
jgi:hypothetical protein